METCNCATCVQMRKEDEAFDKQCQKEADQAFFEGADRQFDIHSGN